MTITVTMTNNIYARTTAVNGFTDIKKGLTFNHNFT